MNWVRDVTSQTSELMSYIEESLSVGEKVEGLFKLHWFAWIPMAIGSF